MKNKITRARAALAGLALFAPSAWADGLDMFQPVAGDKSVSLLLKPIFGTVFGGDTSPLETAFKTFNAIVLAFGGILLFYSLVVGVMQTAHDGEMLGKKWSSVWVPIRVALGTAMVVPVSGGYCSIQLLIGWLVLQGVGAADTLWADFAQSQMSQQGMDPRVSLPPVDDLAAAILKSQVCMAVANSIASVDPQAQTILPSNFQATATDNGGRQYGSADIQPDICGSVTYVYSVTQGDTSSLQATGSTIDSSFVTSISSLNPTNGKASALRGMHMAQVQVMETALAPLAQKIAAGKGLTAADATVYQNAINTYQKNVSQQAVQLIGSETAFKEVADAASSDGFMLAGAWYMKAAALQDSVAQAVGAVPSAAGPHSVGTMAEQPLNQAYAALATFHRKAVGFGVNDPDAAGDTTSSPFGKAMHSLGAAVNKAIFAGISPNPTRNGVMGVKDVGDSVEMGATAGLTASALVLAGTEEAAGFVSWATFGAVKVPEATLQMIANIAIILLVPLLMLGSLLGTLVPLMPFLLFMGAFAGWLLLVCEAMIAAPLWAVMHIGPSDDLAGSQKQGYMLVLGLTLRPVLLVMGFIFALLVLDPLLRAFNSIFLAVFQASLSDSFIGISADLAMIGIYGGSVVWIIKFVLSFIHVIPDQLLRWIGGGHEQLGQAAKGMAEGGHAGFAAVISHYGRQGGGAGGAKAAIGRSAGGDAAGVGGPGAALGRDSAGVERNRLGGGDGPMPEKRGPVDSAGSDSANGNGQSGGSSLGQSGEFAGSTGGTSGSGAGSRSGSGGASGASGGGRSGFGSSRAGGGRRADFRGGGQVKDFGPAPYKNEANAPESYFVSYEDSNGETKTQWGVGLKDAMDEADAGIGDQISLARFERAEGETQRDARQWAVSKSPQAGASGGDKNNNLA